MNDLDPAAPISPLLQRLIDDMTMRRFSRETQRNYIRDVHSPGTATAEDLRRFQVEQREAGVPVPMMNRIVSLRFYFTHTLDRPDFPAEPIGRSQIIGACSFCGISSEKADPNAVRNFLQR